MTVERTELEPGGERCMAVVGLGYVGLPLAAVFAEAGFSVVGLDVDAERVALVNSGRSPTPDVSDELVTLLVERGRLRASTEFSEVGAAGLVSICVPTPLGKSKDPDISYIVDATSAIVPHVRSGAVVVLESTTYPGTTREIILPRFEERGFTAGDDLFLAHSPERVDPGNREWTIRNTPKVIGGITAACTDRAAMLYEQALEEVVRVPSAEAAEMVKLLENTYRSINIGLVNELAIVCHRLGLPTAAIIDAAATKPFGFARFDPGPGLGGHCIPIDPLYLSWKMRTLDYKVRFIDLADEVNSGMPAWVCSRAAAILNEHRKAVSTSRILLLGVAYKPGVDDTRESPAVDVWDGLASAGAELSFHDPLVPALDIGGRSVEGLDETAALGAAWDLVIVTTDHGEIDFAAFAELGVPIFDTRSTEALRGLAHVYDL